MQNDLARARELLGRGLLEDAMRLCHRIIEHSPDHALAHYFLGYASYLHGDFGQAIAAIRAALVLRADLPKAHSILGLILKSQGHLAAAVAEFELAVTQEPTDVHALNGLGAALEQLDLNDKAGAAFERALRLQPGATDALIGLARVRHRRGDFAGALELLDKALESNPGLVDALILRGRALMGLELFGEAAAAFEQALEINPDDVQALDHCGLAYEALNRTAEAIACYERILTIAPDHAGARFAACMAELPKLYMTESEIAVRRAAYDRRLGMLAREAEHDLTFRSLGAGVASDTPFYLAYQGLNDRDLQARYGSLVCRIMADRFAPSAMPEPPKPAEPLRLGIVSHHFLEHTVWKLLIHGLLTQLDRQKFQLFGYHTSAAHDLITVASSKFCARFVTGPLSMEAWRAQILQDRPHALIYPGLLMDAVTVQLAAQRLAPVQCAMWGHPETSGLSTLDYFLSGELMEPPGAEDHYTERLVTLPNLSIHYEPLGVQPSALSRADLGLRANAVAFWCGQSLFKYLPQYDWVFAHIARQAAPCQFLFIETQAPMAALFRQRLANAFADVGLSFESYCVFVRRANLPDFLAGIQACDVVLDSIGFSGGNTILETLEFNRPIVSIRGPLMRGRIGAAILERMGVTDTIADDLDDYVRMAVRLARDLEWRQAIAARIEAGKSSVYRDRSAIEALQTFLAHAVRGN